MTETNTLTWHHDIVGSFLRLKKIKEARDAVSIGEMISDELREIEDAEIKQLVEEQVELGLRRVTEGLFSRSWWHLDFMWGLDGVEKAATASGMKFHGIETRNETASLTGKIGCSDHPFLEDFKFLQAIVPEG